MLSLIFRNYASKLYPSVQSAIFDISNNSSIAIGGFGNCGVPESLISGLSLKNLANLAIVSNSAGIEGHGVQVLLKKRQVKRLITTYVGDNENLFLRFNNGDIELELVPCGTLAEKLRAGGAGIPAFYTSTGAGTMVAEGNFPEKIGKFGKPEILSKPKETKIIDGKTCLLEESIITDFALVKAWKGDKLGNLVYRGTAQNFNPLVAMAGKVVIAEVEELVDVGELDPNFIHTPGIYVDRIVVEKYKNKIERLTLDTGNGIVPGKAAQKQGREFILKRAGKELKDGMYVNLTPGMPTLIPYFVPEGIKVQFLSDNGMLGIGAYPKPGFEDPDIINTGKESCTETLGCSYFNIAEAYNIIRGGHLDLNIVGAMQVSLEGDVANWLVPGKLLKGIGPHMDIFSSDTKCIVLMEYTNKTHIKILKKCILPILGKQAIDLLITELGVFDFNRPEGITLIEIANNVNIDQISALVEGKFHVASDLKVTKI